MKAIGALFHVPHGISNTMLWGKCLSYVLDGAYEQFGRLGREAEWEKAYRTDDQRQYKESVLERLKNPLKKTADYQQKRMVRSKDRRLR